MLKSNQKLNIKLICGNHENLDNELILKENTLDNGFDRVFYNCVCYDTDYWREHNDHFCTNRLGITPYLKMVEHIQTAKLKCGPFGSFVSLKNQSWKDGLISYQIIKDTPEETVVLCTNARAINKNN